MAKRGEMEPTDITTDPQSPVGSTIVRDRMDFDEPSIFLPESMLREMRRQRRLSDGAVPEICLLDHERLKALHDGAAERILVDGSFHVKKRAGLFRCRTDD